MPLKMTSAGSGVSMWPTALTVAGTRWHSLHATSRCQVAPVAMCDWWAPTPRSVVTVPPVVSFGGALLVPPWHELHAWLVLTSRLPSMCLVVSRNVWFEPGLTSLWQAPQSAFWGCGSGGGKPWHDVHWACVPSTRCHRSEEHTSELQSRVDISYAVFCLKK